MRFLTQKVTGVQRFAYEIVKELDQLLCSCPKLEVIGLMPNRPIQEQYLAYKFKNIQILRSGKFAGHIWEQLELPFYSYGYFVVNLCNTSPIFKLKKYIVLHDVIFMTKYDSQKWWFKLWYQLITRLSIPVCRHWFTVSEFSKLEIVKYLKIKSDKITVLGNAPSLNCLEPDNRVLLELNLDSQAYFLMIGSDSKRKNTQMVAKLFAESADLSHTKLVIVGGKFANLSNTANPILADNIHYLGYVTDQELVSLYKGATALIFPSVYEGFGLPVIEAMGLHCPVIVANIDVLKELCKDSVLYFDPMNPYELEQKIKALANPKLKEQISDSAYIRSLDFSWAKSASALLDTILNNKFSAME